MAEVESDLESSGNTDVPVQLCVLGVRLWEVRRRQNPECSWEGHRARVDHDGDKEREHEESEGGRWENLSLDFQT